MVAGSSRKMEHGSAQCLPSWHALWVVFLATTLAVTVAPAMVNAGQPALMLEVTLDQSVTAKGRAMSLRTVVEELCWRGGVQLLGYDAADRPFAANIEELPFRAALERLLNRESHIIWQDAGSSATPGRVAWMKVLGDYETAKFNREQTRDQDVAWQLPPMLLRAVFSATDAESRASAVGTLSRRILESAEDRAGFLGTQAELMSQALARFPGAADTLAFMAEQAGADEEIRLKLLTVRDALLR